MRPQGQTMRPGDVLVYWGKHPDTGKQVPSHIGIASRDGNIVHNTISPGRGSKGFAGVVNHKAGSAAQGYLGHDGAKIEVFRGDPKLGESAARFAEVWAAPTQITGGKDWDKVKERDYSAIVKKTGAPPDDFKPLTRQMNPWLAAERPLPIGEFATSKSPYSTKRLEIGQTTASCQWDLMSAFRAVKAVVRAHTDQGLSPRHGTSCDQFVMYCYQAASVQKMLGDAARLDGTVIDLIQSRSREIKLYLKENAAAKDLAEDVNFKGPGWDKLRDMLEKMTGDGKSTGFLPQELATDAKTSSVMKLYEKLTSDDSGFRYTGSLNKAGNVVEEPQLKIERSSPPEVKQQPSDAAAAAATYTQ